MRRAPAFFAYARKRQQIFLDREAGKPEPWTRDEVLGRYRFCNVFREDDKTTRWFRENVRDPRRNTAEVLLATVVFRMFNRIQTGEAIFRDDDLLGCHSAFDRFAENGEIRYLKSAILRRLGDRGPYVTGSYIISTPPGFNKLDGVLKILQQFYRGHCDVIFGSENWNWGWKTVAHALRTHPEEQSLEKTWDYLRQFDYLGVFHSYEIVTDLRHTKLLENAPDVMTWANPGPGARRGLCRVWGESLDRHVPREDQIARMRRLLESSGDARMWPAAWPRWEMREVEHTLCEWDKMERTRLGQGRPRGVFR